MNPITMKAVAHAKIELVLKLQQLNVPHTEFTQYIMGNKEENEKITIYELKHALYRQPLRLTKPNDKLLAQYLIQNDEVTPYPHNKFLKKQLSQIESKLKSLIGKYYVYDATSEAKVHSSVIEKLSPYTSSLSKTFADTIKENSTIVDSMKICITTLKIELTDEQIQYLNLVLFRATSTIYPRNCDPIIKMIEEVKGVAKEIKESSSKVSEKNKNEYEEDAFETDENANKQANDKKSEEPKDESEPKEYSEPKDDTDPKEDTEPKEEVDVKVNEQQEDAKANEEPHVDGQENDDEPRDDENAKNEKGNKSNKPTHSAPEVEADGDQEDLTNTNERLMIDIAQKAFMQIADILTTQQTDVRDCLSPYIEVKVQNKENIEVISTANFLKVLKKIGVELEKKDTECLIKVLCLSEDSFDYLRIDDFEQIINEYKNPEEGSKQGESEMNDISLVILFVISNYLAKSKKSLRDFLDQYINIQPIKLNDGEDKEIEVIKSEDFFTIIESLGVSMDPSELTNLIELLAISPEHTNILKFSSLNKLLNQFNSSEQMKALAMQIYEQIIKEQDPEELAKAKEEEIDSAKNDKNANQEDGPSNDNGQEESPNKMNNGAPEEEVDYNADQEQFEKVDDNDDPIVNTQ